MKFRKINFVWIVVGVVVVIGLAFGFLVIGNGPTNPENVLKLKQPSFVRSAMASEGSFLDEEAGISAYTQTSSSINLSNVRDVFRTIERETDQYIIGSVDIPGYNEDHSPHVYVHTDGWVLAYYYNTEPASYMMDLRHYDGVEIGTTKLEDAIHEILSVIGVVNFDADFYDFRYPDATNIMLVAETNYDGGNESFEIHLPSDFTYYDRSWTHFIFNDSGADASLYLDDNLVHKFDINTSTDGWYTSHGSLTTAELPPGISHTMKIWSDGYGGNKTFCGLALVYKEVP